MNSANIQIIVCYTNYFNNSDCTQSDDSDIDLESGSLSLHHKQKTHSTFMCVVSNPSVPSSMNDCSEIP